MTDEKSTGLVSVPETAQGVNQQRLNEPEPKAGLKDYLRIFTFSSRYDVVLNVIATLAAIGAGSTLALIQVIFGSFVTAIQDFTQGGDVSHFRHEVSKYALYFVYMGIARFALVYIYTVCFTVTAARIARSIRYAYLKSTLSQDVAFFDDGGHGSVSSQIVTNGNLIQSGLGEKLGLTIQALSAFTSAFIAAFVTNAKLTGITICVVPTIIIIVSIASSIEAKIETKQLDIFARAGSFAEDVLSSIRTVHAFWARPRLVAKYDKYLQEAHAVGQKKSPVYMVLFSTEFFLIYVAFSLCFWQGLRMYNSGELSSPGTIVTVLFSVEIATVSLTQVAPLLLTFVSATSGAAALFRSIDRRSAIDPFDLGGEVVEEFDGEITLNHVNFTYPSRPDTKILHDFTLNMPAGKTTALVGASGSGKSTIVALLERWYDINTGSIMLDGTPINKLNLRWLRTNVRLVQQEPVLFMGTVFENVKYGLVGTRWEHDSEANQRKLVEDACRIANAHEFVSELPNGYDTECGERAGLLSGGQKQRIAIARSIISNPKVLLLDEATSALDPPSEKVVQRALDQASSGRTTIVIAHKLATIKNADNIVVMSKGRIVEQGTHQALIDADGAYSTLVKVQDLGQAAEKALEDDVQENEGPSEDNTALRKSLTRFASEQINKVKHDNDRNDYDLHKQINMFKIVWTLVIEQKRLVTSYAMVGFACLVGGAAYPGQALLFSNLLAVFQLQQPQRSDRGNFFALMFFIMALGQLFAYGIMGWFMNITLQEMIHKYRTQLFDAMLKQDMQFFDRPENTSGALTSHLSSYPQSITELMGFNLAIILVCIINLVASSVLGLVYSWRLGVVVIFAGLPPLVASGWIRLQLDLKLQKENSKLYASSASLAGEGVAAIRTVTSLTLERTILDRFEERLRNIVRTTIWQTLRIMIWFALTQTIEFFFLALGFWYGCLLLSEDKISIKAFYITFVGTFFSGQAASQFFSYSTSITKAKGGANYIFWMRSLQPKIGETKGNQDIDTDSGLPVAPGLNDLRFSYPLRPEAQVLRGVSLSVLPGQFVALVGASGCGKSTLVAMLERFYDPMTGSIAIQEGVNITQLNPKLYRDLIGLVQQEPTLYQDTIRENVALGRRSKDEDVTEEKIIDALKQANAWEFVSSLPQGLDTMCGSRGQQLSGGQRQRIAIARALIRDPKIILLDEATSALDTQSEKVVQAALSEAAKQGKRITVAVAHRLSTIKDADVICVFLGGKIVETGTHSQLLNRGGLYAGMCAAQSLDQEVGS